MPDFKTRIKALRKQKGWTQEELANKIGVSHQAVSHYERGIRTPDQDTLIMLCEEFNVSTDYILGIDNLSLRFVDPLEFQITPDERELVKAYRRSNTYTRLAVLDLLRVRLEHGRKVLA